jgi:uncharacterized membrane protein HdeD (DUF308 family)
MKKKPSWWLKFLGILIFITGLAVVFNFVVDLLKKLIK